MSAITSLSAYAIAENIKRKDISPIEIAESYLQRIELLASKLNAFVEVNAASVREQARLAERAILRGDQLGPLHGVPLSVKSSLAVGGMRQEAGSKLRYGVVAEQDAVAVARLKDAGAIILGTTNVAELLMAWETDNLLYGRTNNPWDLERTPGGSSGGEAAAIASCCSAGGVGGDGGGSIRVPAHFAGICGLKPTPGRIPSTGHFPESLGPFAQIGVIGPMARTVGDLKLLFEVLQGEDLSDTSSAPVGLRWRDEAELRKKRIGFFEDDGRTPVSAETRAAVQAAVRKLRSSGFQVELFTPDGLEAARQLWWQFFGVAGGMMLAPVIKGREGEIGPVLSQFVGWTSNEPAHSGESLLQAWVQRDQLRAKVFGQMREFPVLLCPVAAIPAFRHGERSWKLEGREVNYLDAWSYCEWFNLLGMPAVSMPAGKSQEGLPIGVQLAGLPWQEEVILQVAEALEKEGGAWSAPPKFL